MFKIGDFSKLTQVSAKMLRHYDEIGLLKPFRVDAQSGYRYYSASQLPELNRILVLKDLGFSLEQIRHMQDERLSLEELRGMLKLRRVEIEARLQAEQDRLNRVASRLRYLDIEQQQPNYEIFVRPVPARLMATIRQRVPHIGAPITALFDHLEAHVMQQGARAFHSPLMIYHDAEYRETDLDIEIAVPLSKACLGDDLIQIREIEGAPQVACVVYTGDYDKTPEVLNALIIWIETHGYSVAGSIREVYLRFGADAELNLPDAFLTPESKSFVTELQLPITKELET